MLFKISQNSLENICVGASFLIKLQTSGLTKKEIPTQVLYCEFYEIFKNTYFVEHMRRAASETKDTQEAGTRYMDPTQSPY